MPAAEGLLEGLAGRGQRRGRCAYVALRAVSFANRISTRPTYRRVRHVMSRAFTDRE